jgi:hypothetical protein
MYPDNVDAKSSYKINGTTVIELSSHNDSVVFPPVALTSNTTIIANQLYGNGTYITSTSSEASVSTTAYKAFDKITDWPDVYLSHYSSPSHQYNNSGYIGNVSTTVSGVSILGEWLQIELPESIFLTSYDIFARVDINPAESPKKFTLAGSVNGSTWLLLDTQNDITWYNPNSPNTFNVVTSSLFKYFRLITEDTNNPDSALSIADMVLKGRYTVAYDIINGHFTGSVDAMNYTTSSDERIKMAITDLDTNNALAVIRNIAPKQFSFIDYNVSNKLQVGFIAQDVKESIDSAVSLKSDYIPNVYDSASVSDGSNLTLHNVTTDKLVSSLLGLPIKLRLVCENNVSKEVSVRNIVDAKSVTIEEQVVEKVVFVYGQKVDDYHLLDKQTIFTFATAAIKQIDKDLQSEKEAHANTRMRLEALEARVFS